MKKTTVSPNFSLIAFFVSELFESEVGRTLDAADRRQF